MAKVIKENTPTFDPQKNYRWDPQDVFELTGQQFASIYHALNQEINNPGGTSIALKVEAFGVVMDMFKHGVAQGVITEQVPMDADTPAQVEGKVKNLFKK